MTSAPGARLRHVDAGKPRMRGWLHVYAFWAALGCGAVLCAVAASRPEGRGLGGCTVYSVLVCGLFGTSALYHRRVWSRRMFPIMRRLDHSMIFAFIAGTYTPLAALLLEEPTATMILTVVWGGAAAGIAVKMVAPGAPRWLSTSLYMLLGWVAVAVLPSLHRGGGTAVLVLILVGGGFYTAGAVFYTLRRPNPWPDVFGHHEVFHAFTVVAALCHHIAVYFALYAGPPT